MGFFDVLLEKSAPEVLAEFIPYLLYFCGLAELMFLKTICNSVNVTRNPIPFMTIVVCSIAMIQIQTIKSALG